jgi:hypothetical protein
MTAATITRPPAGAEVIEEARETFRAARAATWPDGDRDGIVAAVRALGTAVQHWDDLRNGTLPWWLDGIRPGADSRDDALRRAADIAWEASEEVTGLIGENEMAAATAGDGGKKS